MDWTYRLRLRHLQILLSLAQTGNLSQSAQALHSTQPALSKWLKELEADIGLPLFERRARGLRPTAYGEALIEHARRLQGHLDSAREDMAALRDDGSGRVVIGTSGVSAADTVPLAVARLLRVLPRAQVRLVESTMNLMLPQLVRGELDIVVGRTVSADPDSRLQCETLYREPIDFVAGVQHPLVAQPPRAAGIGIARAGTARMGTARMGTARTGIAQIDATRADAARVASTRVDTARTDTTHVDPARIGVTHVDTTHIGATRVGTMRVGATTARPPRPARESRAIHAPCATNAPRELTWDDLFRYPWIVWPHGTPVRNALENALAAAGRTMPRDCVESNSSILNVTLLGHSELIGVASHRAALRFAQLGALRILPMRLEGYGSVSMYWRADSLSRTAVALTLEHLRACAREGRGVEQEQA